MTDKRVFRLDAGATFYAKTLGHARGRDAEAQTTLGVARGKEAEAQATQGPALKTLALLRTPEARSILKAFLPTRQELRGLTVVHNTTNLTVQGMGEAPKWFALDWTDNVGSDPALIAIPQGGQRRVIDRPGQAIDDAGLASIFEHFRKVLTVNLHAPFIIPCDTREEMLARLVSGASLDRELSRLVNDVWNNELLPLRHPEGIRALRDRFPGAATADEASELCRKTTVETSGFPRIGLRNLHRLAVDWSSGQPDGSPACVVGIGDAGELLRIGYVPERVHVFETMEALRACFANPDKRGYGVDENFNRLIAKVGDLI